MPSLWTWWRGERHDAGEQAALLRVGDSVRLQAAGDGQMSTGQARVHALGLRRIFLDLSPETQEWDLPARAPLTVFFARADALYRFETHQVGPLRRGTLAVAWPRQIVRVQRRQFYRLPLESPTTLRVLNDDGRASSAPLPARLVNLSGGGALVALGKPVPPGLLVSVRVPTGKTGDLLPLDADVLDCTVAQQGRARVYLLRLRFFSSPHLSDEDREAVIAFLHEQQRLLLRARKLLRA